MRILVADDETRMQAYYRTVLAAAGHEVVGIAGTGRELVEQCGRLAPDLVISDIKMPDMDGIEASTHICRDQPIPVILVSAYHDPELIERAEGDHVLAYLVKPIGKADLAPAIAVAVRRFGELQTLRKEASDLRQALADRKVIEQSKGVLMRVTGISEKDAFRRLQELAADKNQKLIDAANAILSLEKALRPGDGG
jgi:response regulator NasT